MAITPLPSAPQVTDDTATFNTKAFAWVDAIDTWTTEANALATQANTDASTATTQAGIATTQAGIATTKASEASADADAAAASAVEAAGLVENYQGALASDPALNKDGGALAAGDWYVNTSTGLIRAYTGSVWVTSVNVTAGVESLNGLTGVLTGFVTETDTQTLTNKTITGTKETKVAIAASDIDLSAGNYFTKTISGATTFTVSNTATTGSVSAFILDLTNGGSATITWFSGVTWAAGTPPTLTASGRDVLGFFTHDGGTTWNGLVLGLAMA